MSAPAESMREMTYPALKGGASGGVWPFLNGTTLILLGGVTPPLPGILTDSPATFFNITL